MRTDRTTTGSVPLGRQRRGGGREGASEEGEGVDELSKDSCIA